MPPAECGSWHCWNRRSGRWCRPASSSRNGWHLSARSTTRETKLRPRTSAWQACTDKTTGDSPTAPCLRVRSTARYPISTRSFKSNSEPCNTGISQPKARKIFDTRCCRCAAATHCRYSLRSPIYCSSGFQKSTRCRYRVRATTCRAGIPPPSPPASSSSSPTRMIWMCQMSNRRRFDLDASGCDERRAQESKMATATAVESPKLKPLPAPRFKRTVESKGGYLSASKLKWELLTKKRGSSTQGIPAGKEHLAWVTNTVTLIYGERDAVLVDTFLSAQQSSELVDWVVASGKNLVAVYVTHAHGDHFFGLKALVDRFPNAKAIATAPVVAAIQKQITPESIKSVWEPRFPGQIPSELIAPSSSRYLETDEM